MGIARRLFPYPNTGRFTLIVLATSPLFFFLGRITGPDMHMALWITAAIYCLVRVPDGRRFAWMFFVCAGFGFLTKGPVAILVPFAAAVGYSAGRRKAGLGRLRLPWFAGIPLTLVIGLSWFLVLVAKNPALGEYFYQYELIDRVGSGSHGRSKPFWFFIPVLALAFLPWTIPALRRLPAALRSRRAETGLFLGWLAVPFLVLSVSGSKLPTYVLPLIPGLALALAGAFAAQKKDPSKGVMCSGVGLFVLWAIVPSQVSGFNDRLGQQASIRPLAERILAETSGDAEPPRVISCEIRAHGLEFYLGRSVEMTKNEADIVLPPHTIPGADFPEIHATPTTVSKLSPGPGGAPLYVVTRNRSYDKSFVGRGWTVLQTAGDFVLLRGGGG